MSNPEGRAEPPDFALIRKALDREASASRAWAEEAIKGIERQRDERLRQLEGALHALDHGHDEVVSPTPRPTGDDAPKRRRRRSRKRPTTTPAAAQERREGMLRYLREQEAPRSRREISRALGLTADSTTNGLRLLCEEGLVERVGNRSSTRYKPRGTPLPADGQPIRPKASSVQGQILETLQDRRWASLDELVQAVGAAREEVLKQCGALVREEEIRMERREGRAVYIIVPRETA